MKPHPSETKYMALADLAVRWGCHRSTASRTLQRFGIPGLKMGRAKSASIRYRIADIERVERAAEPRHVAAEIREAS